MTMNLNISTMSKAIAGFGGTASKAPSSPHRELRTGGIIIGAFLAIGIGWASFAPLDSAVVAPATVKISGERQKVQVLHEGVISAINATEGATVRAGQILVEFAGADAKSNERSLATRAIGLQAEVARLEAQRLGQDVIAVPESFASLGPADKQVAARAMELEKAQLKAQTAVRSTESAVLVQRVAQIDDQMAGFSVRRQSTEQQRALMEKQLANIRALASQGYAAKNRLYDLERAAAELDGTIGSLGTENARLRNSAGEARLQMALSRGEELKTAADQLRQAQNDLQSLLPQWAAAREQLARTQVRAPVSGTVVGLAVHTVGGVAPSGQTLMEIVPFDRSLTVEGQVKATDVNQLRKGQAARLRIVALHGRAIPELQGAVTRVSADSFVDERSGQSFYTVSVSVPPSELRRLVDAAGPAGRLRPGNPVQIIVTLRPRSALEYWLEPLTQTFSNSLHEQ